ncbi:Gag-Pol polyprotein [Plecturocebus cupreus]
MHYCRQHNVRQGRTILPGIQAYGAAPFEDLQVDFAEMLKCGGHRHLLVPVCTYSGFGLPLCIGPDSSPAFVANLVSKMAMALNITRKLHPTYGLQSFRKVELMNLTIKSSLGQMCQETGLKWVQALLMVLFKITCTPSKKTGYSLYEVLYHRPPPILWALLATPQ